MKLERIEHWIQQFEADKTAIKAQGFTQELYQRYEAFKWEVCSNNDLEKDRAAIKVWQQIKDIAPRNLERFYNVEAGSLVEWYQHKSKFKQA